MAGLRGQELIIVAVVLLVLFGGAKLPQLARNVGRAQKEFKDGLAEGKSSTTADATRRCKRRRRFFALTWNRTDRAGVPRADTLVHG